MVKNMPSNAGETGSIPGQGIKIPHAVEQLSTHASPDSIMTLGNKKDYNNSTDEETVSQS